MSKKQAAASNGCLTKNDFAAMEVDPPVRVDLPGGEHTFVRSLEGYELADYQGSCFDDEGAMNRKDFQLKLVQLCACDDRGKRLFGRNDLEIVRKVPARVTSLMFAEAEKLNVASADKQKRTVKN